MPRPTSEAWLTGTGANSDDRKLSMDTERLKRVFSRDQYRVQPVSQRTSHSWGFEPFDFEPNLLLDKGIRNSIRASSMLIRYEFRQCLYLVPSTALSDVLRQITLQDG